MIDTHTTNSKIYAWIIENNNENYYKCLEYRYILSYEEQHKAGNFKFEKDMRSYIISHISLRLLLSMYSKEQPKQIKFRTNHYGKPSIEIADLHFNLSHSHQKILIGIYKREIGVDVEYIDTKLNIDDFSNLILTTKEKSLLDQLNASNKQIKFFELWTRKEALLKAIGTGINNRINDIDLSDLDYFNNCTTTINSKKWRIESFDINDRNYSSSISYNSNEYVDPIIHHTISLEKLLSFLPHFIPHQDIV